MFTYVNTSANYTQNVTDFSLNSVLFQDVNDDSNDGEKLEVFSVNLGE